MASMSTRTPIGNGGADPDATYLPSGQAVTSFSVAVNERRHHQAGATGEATQWYGVSCFSRLAEITDDLVRKGRSVFVEGSLQVREYVGADGQKRVSLGVAARDLQLLDSRGGDAQGRLDPTPWPPTGRSNVVGRRRARRPSMRVEHALPF